ncbi:Pathogenesis-related protein 1 [Bienertia sinuspersici]
MKLLLNLQENMLNKDLLILKTWVGEKPDYDITNNNYKKMCGHYTQVVWTGTRSVGCVKVMCQNGGTFIGCNYYLPRNKYIHA